MPLELLHNKAQTMTVKEKIHHRVHIHLKSVLDLVLMEDEKKDQQIFSLINFFHNYNRVKLQYKDEDRQENQFLQKLETNSSKNFVGKQISNKKKYINLQQQRKKHSKKHSKNGWQKINDIIHKCITSNE